MAENNIKHWLEVIEGKFNSGYTLLKSITMKDGAYIKTDYAATTGFIYEGSFSFNSLPDTDISSASVSTWPMGICRNAPTTTANLYIVQDQKYLKPRFQFVNGTTLIESELGEIKKYKCQFKSGSGKLWVNDVQVYGADISTYNASSIANSYVCFGLNSVSTTFSGNQIIYDINGIVVRKMEPAMRRSDGACGLLDSVTGQFYTNANTSKTSSIVGSRVRN